MYHNLEGQWRDLFNRLKWDTVKSALKSVAGLQGRKFKVQPIHSWPANSMESPAKPPNFIHPELLGQKQSTCIAVLPNNVEG